MGAILFLCGCFHIYYHMGSDAPETVRGKGGQANAGGALGLE